MKKNINILKNINKKYYLILGVILILLIIVIGYNFLGFKDGLFSTNSDGDIFADEYESLNNKMADDKNKYPKVNIKFDNIKYISVDELLKMLSSGSKLDGTGAVYIGYAECLYCRNAVQILIDTAKKSNIDKIYYLDISEVWDIKELDSNGEAVEKQAAASKYFELLDRLGDEYTKDYILSDKDGKEVNLGYKRVEAPLVLFVVGGEIVSSHIGTTYYQKSPFDELDEYQKSWLSDIYKYGLRDVVDGINYFKQLEIEEAKQKNK